MGFLDSLFGGGQKKPGRAADSQGHSRGFANSTHGSPSALSSVALPHAASGAVTDERQRFKIRRDMLRVVLRDMLTRSGIPPAWIEIHPLAATSSSKQTGVHARFLVKHWSPLVLMNAPGLERLFIERLLALDPLADEWVMGLSWQLELPADNDIAPLPKPGTWSLIPIVPGSVRTHAPLRPVQPAPQHDAGVIEGPVHVDAIGELDRMLADGDAATRHVPSSYDATQPAPLR